MLLHNGAECFLLPVIFLNIIANTPLFFKNLPYTNLVIGLLAYPFIRRISCREIAMEGMRMKKLWVVLSILLLLSTLVWGVSAEGLDVQAKSALLMDVATGTILYEKNAHEPLPPASVTKVMTMLLIMEAIDSGAVSYSDTVTTSETAAAKGGSQVFLKVGETMSVSEMLKSIAVSSANDCACAMAEHLAGSEAAFVERMNERAKELGLNDTHFVNCTGLDDGPDAASHRTSAHDIAVMSRELLSRHPDITKYTTIWMDTIRGGAFGLSNTNKLIRFYPGATGLKTGFTSTAGYCLSATAKREDLELIAVVMGCESAKIRTAACKSMLDYGFAGYALVTPGLEDAPVVPVRLGKEASVPLQLEGAGSLLVPKAKRSGIVTKLQLEEEVTAPVERGQKLGTLTITSGEETLLETPLVAAQPVPRLTLGEIYVTVLRRIAMAKG